MRFPRRMRWLQNQFALVDKIPFRLPVASKDSPVLFAAFSIDYDKAKALLPGKELHPFQLWKRGILAITVVNYQDTTIGKYVEFCIGIVCTHGRKAAPRLLPGFFTKRYGTGQYIYDLPVSTEISVRGGRLIWGMAKRQANLDFVIGDKTISSQYDLDGQLVMRIDVERPKKTWLPLHINGVGYGACRGLLTKSYVYLKGKGGVALFKKSSARLVMGDHPRMDPIKALDVSPRPLISGFLPTTNGILDDHFETWFLTHDQMPETPYEGLESMVDLGLSQEWLDPPDRNASDELIRGTDEKNSHT